MRACATVEILGSDENYREEESVSRLGMGGIPGDRDSQYVCLEFRNVAAAESVRRKGKLERRSEVW